MNVYSWWLISQRCTFLFVCFNLPRDHPTKAFDVKFSHEIKKSLNAFLVNKCFFFPISGTILGEYLSGTFPRQMTLLTQQTYTLAANKEKYMPR